MLSFLVVVFCVFNHVHGATCVINTDEDLSCTTACNKNCAEYSREPTGARKPDPACAAGETVQDCESIKVSKGISNRNECWNKMQWRDILWLAATDEEKTTGTLTTTRTIPNFRRYWNTPCEIEKSSLAQIRSVSCSDYQGRGPELDPELAAISFADPGPEAPERQRDYLYLVDGKFGKYCDPAPLSPRTAKTNYRDQIFAAFTARATALKICKKSKSEDKDCLTPCDEYGSCAKYGRDQGRDNDELKRHESACKEKREGKELFVSLCESIVKSKVGTNDPNLCLTFEEWVDKMWAVTTRTERAAEAFPPEAFSRDIPDFDDYWSKKCQVKRASEGELSSVHCDNYQKRMQIDPFHVTKERMAWSAKGPEFTRVHLILDSGKLSYYCYPASGKAGKKEAYKAELLAAFTQKAREAKAFARSGTGAAVVRGGRPRPRVIGGALPRPHVPLRGPPAVGAAGPPLRAIAAPLPAPRGAAPMTAAERRAHRAAGRRSRSSSGEVMHAHEEYVDNLWEEVNEIEEDELRYERAWDKLRRAQRSFDMATQLRQLRKKKLRKYYN